MEKFWKRLASYLLPMLCILVLVGCKDREVPEPSQTAQGNMAAEVNGAKWESSMGNFRVGRTTVTNGVTAIMGAGDTLTLIGVQVKGADTTAIKISVKLRPEKVGAYQIRGDGSGAGYAYFLTRISESGLRATKRNYKGGIINGSFQISEYDELHRRIHGNFGFSMSAPGQTTYTAIKGKFSDLTL